MDDLRIADVDFLTHRPVPAADGQARRDRPLRDARGVRRLCGAGPRQGVPAGLGDAADPQFLSRRCRLRGAARRPRRPGCCSQPEPMPTHAERKLVPYAPEQLFDLVADVGKYPQFLPWCVGARVRSRTEQELVADLTIGFGPFRESFTSRVTLDRPRRVQVRYENGPFRYLNNQWDFTPAPGGCRGRFLRRFRVPQPDPAGRDRRGVQRGGAPDGERLPQARPRRLRPAHGGNGQGPRPGRQLTGP